MVAVMRVVTVVAVVATMMAMMAAVMRMMAAVVATMMTAAAFLVGFVGFGHLSMFCLGHVSGIFGVTLGVVFLSARKFFRFFVGRFFFAFAENISTISGIDDVSF